MGQQMDKEAELPLIWSVEIREPDHTQKQAKDGCNTDKGMYSKKRKTKEVHY